jgi:hypothetical protein
LVHPVQKDVIVAASKNATIHLSNTDRHFGVENLPICQTCHRSMQMTRRSPHPIFGNDFELQSFECRRCGVQNLRSVDENGLPHDGGVLLT